MGVSVFCFVFDVGDCLVCAPAVMTWQDGRRKKVIFPVLSVPLRPGDPAAHAWCCSTAAASHSLRSLPRPRPACTCTYLATGQPQSLPHISYPHSYSSPPTG